VEVNMSEITRREFLRLLGVGLGAASAGQFLAACARSPRANPFPAPPTMPPGAIALPTAEPAMPLPPTDTPAEPPPTAASIPDLAVARGGDDPAVLVERALAALGGMTRFVPTGARVLIKPNICVAYHTYEYAATTNPWVVGALVRLALGAGASRVRVLDYPFGGSPDEAYARSGIQEQVEAAGGEMVAVSRMQFLPTDIPQGLDLRSAEIHEQALQSDVLIDVPIAKNHGLAILTLGMKNLMGLILDRQAIHRNIGQRLADLTSLIRPSLTVIDAVRILTANGPTGGNLDDVLKLDTVIASPDIVAADAYASTLFGLRPSDLAYVAAGEAMGLGRSDLASLRIEEIAVGG
jgi:uncharacterized protein (DUF362 family)